MVFIVPTYNSEKYVGATLDSILKQKFTGNWIVLVSDDCSKDNTKRIVDRYVERFPDRVQRLYRSTNVGISGNVFSAISEVNSKYVSYIDADDYLIDDFYIQKQYDTLESHPNVGLGLFDGYNFQDGDENSKQNLNFMPEVSVFDFKYWAKHQFRAYNPQGYFIRKEALPQPFEQWMMDAEYLDWLIIFLVLDWGKIHYTNQKATMHRIHSENYSFAESLSVKRIQGGLI